MSETKLATKADLKEMYNRMLPYLGGMPEVLANKFSKGDLYDTTEKMIGKWIDGKPIYRKTFTGTTSSNNTNTVITHGLPIDIGLVVNGYVDSNSAYIAVGFYNGTNYFSAFVDKTQIQLRADRIYWNNPFVITIQYTKTTDSAISIGSDTDYSTDEKIVGTWIDGKPLYQKTIKITTDSSSATKSISTGIANISAVISADGFIRNSEQCIPMNTTWSSYEANVIFTITSSDTTMVVKAGHSDWQNKTAYITLRYTKTTS